MAANQENPVILDDVTAEEVDILKNLNSAMEYKGFQAAAFRSALFENRVASLNLALGVLPNAVQLKAIAMDILNALVSYINIGNSPSKITSSVRDPAQAIAAVNSQSALGVVQSASTGNGVTLARLAFSFMPIVALLRVVLKSKPRFVIANSVAWIQDAAFRGCPSINSMPGYAEFIEHWTEAMKKSKGYRETATNWNDVAVLGYASDTVTVAHMTPVIASITNNNAEAMFQSATRIIISMLKNEPPV